MPRVWKLGTWPGIGEGNTVGSREDYIEKALANGFVAIGGAHIPSLAEKSIDWIKERTSTDQKAWEWYRFANEIKQGHLIMLYVSKRSTGTEPTKAYLGVVESPPIDLKTANARSGDAYYFVPKSHKLAKFFPGPDYAPHRLNVKWLPPREGFEVSIPYWNDTVHEILEEDLGNNVKTSDDKAKSHLRKFLANDPDNTGPYIKTGERQSRTAHRIGQGKIRDSALQRYSEQCALCSIDLPSLLVAGHIQGWADNEQARSQEENVILMCSLHDSLFGRGFFRITPGTYRLVYSPQLSHFKDAFSQIKKITSHQLRIPTRGHPAKEYLEWHTKSIFLSE